MFWPHALPARGTISTKLKSVRRMSNMLASKRVGIDRNVLLALTRLETGIFLVDDVDASLPPYDAAVLVAALQRAQRIADFHTGLRLFLPRRICQKAPETMHQSGYCQPGR